MGYGDSLGPGIEAIFFNRFSKMLAVNNYTIEVRQ
jgi:hypothetical protein